MTDWKEKNSNIHVLDLPSLQVLVHRKQNYPDRWYLTVDNAPLVFKDWPLSPMDLNLAKDKAVELLFKKSECVRNSLQTHLKNDSKKVDSLKLKLIAMLEKAEYIQRDISDHQKLKLDPLMKMIKSAITDLD